MSSSSTDAGSFVTPGDAGVPSSSRHTSDGQAWHSPSAGALALRNALVDAFGRTGPVLLKDPHRLCSYVMDLAKDETP